MDKLAASRARMVEQQLRSRGIAAEAVLEAMRSVRRERFVPSKLRKHAYADRPLSIGSGQTISQPFIVALMAQAAEITTTDRVLEVGTGSGYGAAVLSRLAAEVWTMERHKELADLARSRLLAEGLRRVHVGVGDGSLGWPEEAPFDVIVVTASGPFVPPRLLEQLVEGGRLIMPIGTAEAQSLVRLRKVRGKSRCEDLGPVRFVPLIGAQGWPGAKK